MCETNEALFKKRRHYIPRNRGGSGSWIQIKQQGIIQECADVHTLCRSVL